MARLSRRELLWNSISRTCFQDRVMPYAYWLLATTDRNHREHKKVLNQSVAMIPGKQFVDLIGESDFVKRWKELRADVSSDRSTTKQGALILDSLWSSIVTGFAFSNPNVSINKPISSGLKSTYLDICKYSKRSIYQVAKDTNRAYSRVHGDAKKLELIGLVTAVTGKQDGRTVSFLSANTR
ncbi:MAG: hypothetical protein WCG35_11270 [Betaproteobacteria bacterium]